jgi:hypothetical protein
MDRENCLRFPRNFARHLDNGAKEVIIRDFHWLMEVARSGLARCCSGRNVAERVCRAIDCRLPDTTLGKLKMGFVNAEKD